MPLHPSRPIQTLLLLAACGLPSLAAAQAASGTAAAGLTVSITSADAAVVHAFAAACRQRGFTIIESSTVTRTQGGGGWSFNTASTPMYQATPPSDVTTTTWTARAVQPGPAPGGDALMAETTRCQAFVATAGGTCSAQAGAAR